MNASWKKRGIILLLIAAFCIALIGPVAASGNDPTPNQDILDAMIYGDRNWVIATLVNDDRSSNPMALLQGNGTKKSLAKNSLDTFRGINEDGQNNDAAYRGLVHVMEKWYNKEDYVESFVNKLLDAGGELLSWVTGLFSSQESVRETANRLTTSVDEMRYDSLLKGIFSAKYTASNGMTLQDTESSLMTVKQVKETFDFMKTVFSLARSHVDTIVDSSERSVFEAEYISEYALPYGDATQKYLEAVDKIIAPSGSDNSGYIELASNLAIIERLAVLAPTDTYDGFSFTDLIAENLVDLDVQDLLKANGKAINFADTALDQYLYIESIRMQKESINGPLARLQAKTGNSDIRASVQNFNTLLSDEYNNTLCSWDSLFTYLRNNRTVGKTASKFVTKKVKSAAMKLLHISDESMMCYVAAKATTVMDISSWVADQAVGLESTCKKTYELLSWENLMADCVSVYQSDLAAYQSNPTEETAEAVLDDLMLIQKVRLYGEKISYGLASAQFDSWIGKIFGGDVAKEDWDRRYQESVDVLMAASVLPPMSGLTVQSGHTLLIQYREDVGFYGRDIITGGGPSSASYYIPELSAQLAGGITLNGQLAIQNTSGNTLPIGYIDANGTSTLGILDGAVKIGELYQSGGNLSLVTRNTGSVSFDRMYVGNASYIADDPVPITTGDIEVYGTTDLKVSASGDVVGSDSGGSLDTLILSGQGAQALSGKITAGSLTANCAELTQSGSLTAGVLLLNGAKATIEGKVSVTDTLNGANVKLTGGKNIVFSGQNIENGRFNGDLTVQNATVSSIRFAQSIYDKGGTVYAGDVQIDKIYNLQGASTIQNSGRLKIYGTAELYAALSGGALDLYGDLIVSTNLNLTTDLSLLGRVGQDVSGTFTVDTIRFNNSSTQGVNVLNTLTVNRWIENPGGKVNIGTVNLGENAKIAGDYKGTVSVLNWNPDPGTVVTVPLRVRSGGVITGDSLRVENSLILEGAATIDGCRITARGLTSPSALTLQNGAQVTVTGSATVSGTLANPTEFTVYGDLILNGVTAAGPVCARGDIYVSGTTRLNDLFIDGFQTHEISGSSFSVANLSIINPPGKALKLGQTISVTGTYLTPNAKVTGGTIREIPGSGDTITEDTTINTLWTSSNALTVTDCTLTVNGPVSVPNLVLTNATLVINGKLTLTSSSTTSIDESSVVTVNGMLTASSGTINLDGAMNVRSDCIMGSTKLTGGNLIIGSDLYGSAELRPETLTISGLTPQCISADNLHAVDVIIHNPSKSGVTIEKAVYYSGTLDQDGSIRSGEEKLTKEAA